MLKKTITLILAALMICSMAACGQGQNTENTGDSTEVSAVSSETINSTESNTTDSQGSSENSTQNPFEDFTPPQNTPNGETPPEMPSDMPQMPEQDNQNGQMPTDRQKINGNGFHCKGTSGQRSKSAACSE